MNAARTRVAAPRLGVTTHIRRLQVAIATGFVARLDRTRKLGGTAVLTRAFRTSGTAFGGDYEDTETLPASNTPSMARKDAGRKGPPPTPRPSASLILLSQIPHGQPKEDGFDYKVCLILRGSGISSAASTVFPGGNLDPEDTRVASTISQDPLLPLKICALRETFEETGLLLLKPSRAVNGGPSYIAASKAQQERIYKNPGQFLDLYKEVGASSESSRQPPLDTLIGPWSRWITPLTQPKRFDTYFYLYILDASSTKGEPELRADGTETASAAWVTPSKALSDCLEAKRTVLFPPQVYLLSELARLPTLAQVREHGATRRLLTIEPRAKAVGADKKTFAFLYPGDAEYGEIAGTAGESDRVTSSSGSKGRHRTYAEAVYDKQGRAIKPVQPLTVRAVHRVGVPGFADMLQGELPEGVAQNETKEFRQSRKAKL